LQNFGFKLTGIGDGVNVGDTKDGIGVFVGEIVSVGATVKVIIVVGNGVEVGVGNGVFVGVGIIVFVGVGSNVTEGNIVGIEVGLGVVLGLGIIFTVGVTQVEAIAIVGPVKLKCSLDPSAPRSSSPTVISNF